MKDRDISNKKNGNHVFNDIHHYECFSQGMVMDVDFLQLDRTKPRIEHREVELDDIRLRLFSSSHSMQQKIRIEDGWCTFVLLSRNDRAVILNGHHTPIDGICILPSGQEYHVTTTANWSSLEVDFPERLLESSELPIDGRLRQLLRANVGKMQLAEETAKKLSAELMKILNDEDLLSAERVTTRHCINIYRQTVINIMAQSIAAGSNIQFENTAFASSVVQQAQALMQYERIDNPSIEQIANRLNLSIRTLQRSFLQVLGVTPKQYQLAQKLDAARRALRQHGKKTSVADIAYEFGFSSPSRFTEHYQRHFGETPGQQE